MGVNWGHWSRPIDKLHVAVLKKKERKKSTIFSLELNVIQDKPGVSSKGRIVSVDLDGSSDKRLKVGFKIAKMSPRMCSCMPS